MLDNKNFSLHGSDFKYKHRLPSLRNAVDQALSSTKSAHALRLLGTTDDSKLYISEEERSVNFHIIGAPGEGKSKFIVYNAIEDIKKGNGLCLLDPTSNGSTAHEVLQYCASIGYEKVCLIDHTTLYKFGKVATIRPLWGHESHGTIYPDKAAISGVMEAVAILAGMKDYGETRQLKKSLDALLGALVRNGGTIYETKYFKKYDDLRKLDFLGDDEDSDTVEENFRYGRPNFIKYFSSTVNVLNDFWKEPLSLMLNADVGIDFQQMIKDKWVILVNLCPAGNLTITDSKLLGVLLISQILQAADTLTRNSWVGRYYLYIDEVGKFATPQLDDILSHRRHMGLSLILAHQYFRQFENERLLDSISQNTGVKVMFNVRESVDRVRMMKSLGYGGDITPDMAAYANQNLSKQYAIIRKNKTTPVKVRTPDVRVPEIDTTAYIESLLQSDWYLTRKEIKDQINGRITFKSSKSPSNTQYRKTSNSRAANKGNVSRGVQEPSGSVEDSGLPTSSLQPKKPSKPKAGGF